MQGEPRGSCYLSSWQMKSSFHRGLGLQALQVARDGNDGEGSPLFFFDTAAAPPAEVVRHTALAFRNFSHFRLFAL